MTDALWVDFNCVEGNYVWTSVDITPDPPDVEQGQTVTLEDDDGSRCSGIVTSVRHPVITVKLDWSTWLDPGERLAANG